MPSAACKARLADSNLTTFAWSILMIISNLAFPGILVTPVILAYIPGKKNFIIFISQEFLEPGVLSFKADSSFSIFLASRLNLLRAMVRPRILAAALRAVFLATFFNVFLGLRMAFPTPLAALPIPPAALPGAFFMAGPG